MVGGDKLWMAEPIAITMTMAEWIYPGLYCASLQTARLRGAMSGLVGLGSFARESRADEMHTYTVH